MIKIKTYTTQEVAQEKEDVLWVKYQDHLLFWEAAYLNLFPKQQNTNIENNNYVGLDPLSHL